MTVHCRTALLRPLLLPLVALLALALSASSPAVLADHTPTPTSVAIAGSLQSELGCPGDWQPDCRTTWLTYDDADQVWQGAWTVPAGSWEYKAALNGGWDENYGQNATPGGANIPLTLDAPTRVKFYYSHKTHWITDNKSKVIATVPGSFQSELGCPGDWQPDCLRSWLQDPDGDGTYTFSTTALPAGNYEAKVAINEGWDENYGEGGAPGGSNIAFTVPTNNKEVFFSYNAMTHVLTISVAGAPRGNLSQARAYWVDLDTIAWQVPNPATATVKLYYDPNGGLTVTPEGVTGGQSITLRYDPAGLSQAVRDKFPHLANLPAFKIPGLTREQAAASLKGPIAVAAVDNASNPVDATSLQIPGVLDTLFTYTGELGVVYQGAVPTLRVWAPTARSVKLHVYDTSTSTADTVVPMTPDPNTGVWSATGTASWTGKYYLYEVEVFVRTTGRVETNLVTDPYSLSLSLDSRRSQIVNLADASLKPAGWDSLRKPPLEQFEDIVLYELHIRDFSASDSTVPAAYRGTYKAFTVAQSNGMQHLARLARAGLTHVHLLPAFDIATIEENAAQRREPDPAVLASFPPDSDQQQAYLEQFRDTDAFNWGYDPYHYTVPEGSYSTNPDGPTRIVEYREMVQGLNQAGLRVVMDVVYNHTNASGQAEKSVLDKIVPGYYHRLNASGNIERSTCCENTATEHNMMEKLMVDSLVTWAKFYKVDGFRFDLMGHHMKRNMLRVREALNALTPARDGVDGSKIYLYGEGWNFGEVADNARGVNATQLNMAGTGIGTFSDRLRDAVRGGGPFSGLQDQGFATGLFYDPNGTAQGTTAEQRTRLLYYSDLVRLGLAGNLATYQMTDASGATVSGAQIRYGGGPAGYALDPQETISYIEAHDNETWFDAVQLKAAATDTLADRVRMDQMGLSLVMLGQGIPFFQAGQDLLRSKSMDRNSYNSGDWFNRLDWSYTSNNWGVGLPPAGDNRSTWPIMQPLLANAALKPTRAEITQTTAVFQDWLRLRKSSRLFRLGNAADIQAHVKFLNTGPNQTPGLVVMHLDDTVGADIDPRYEHIVVLFNAQDEAVTFTAAQFASQPMRLHPIQATGADPVVKTARYDQASGAFTIPARTTAVFVSAPEAGFVCDPSNPAHVCNGMVVVRAYLDLGCDGFFNRGTDWPLAGASVTARLPDGSVRTGVADANGNILLTGINMVANEQLELELTDAPTPTWVQQAGFGLQACPSSPSRVTLLGSNFGLFRVAFVDFRQSFAGR